jgi:ribose 5-phosphate isomerase B
MTYMKIYVINNYGCRKGIKHMSTFSCPVVRVESVENHPNADRLSIVLASDHAGIELRTHLADLLAQRGHTVQDLGPFDPQSVDYPDYAESACKVVLDNGADRGILVCGSGIGMSMAANRFAGIRCALVHDETTARLSRQHNNSNMIALGARLIDVDLAWQSVLAWLTTPWEGGRHAQRVSKLDGLGAATQG